MEKFGYEEKSLLGEWRIEVKKGFKHIGNIRQNPSTNGFQFFQGSHNMLTPSFEEMDLEILKKKIENK